VTLPDYPSGFLVVAVLAILLTGISKGGFAGGLGGFAVPLMALYISPADAAGIMLPILCLMDLFGLHAYRNRWSRAHLRILLPGALVGIALGALTFRAITADGVRLLVGAIAIAFTLNQWLGLASRIARRDVPAGPRSGRFWAAVSGFTSTLAHAGGPPYAVYMLSQKLDKTSYVATAAVFFTVVNYVKAVPYFYMGQFHAGNLSTSLAFAPLAPIGIWLGVWLHRRLPEGPFYRIAYVLLFLTGLKLVYDGIAG
jgi:uncharacterized membrane protein YfcA